MHLQFSTTLMLISAKNSDTLKLVLFCSPLPPVDSFGLAIGSLLEALTIEGYCFVSALTFVMRCLIMNNEH